jgi:hypothetical protein
MSFDTAMMMDVSYKLNSIAQSSITGQRSDRMGSNGSKPPKLLDIEARDDFTSNFRPASEELKYTSAIQHLEEWQVINEELSIADQRAGFVGQGYTTRYAVES